MSFRLVKACWDLSIPSTEKMVLMCLAEHADDEGKCWPSVRTIARKCSKSVRTVQSALKNLGELGYFEIEDLVGRGRIYRLNQSKICTPAESAAPQKSCETGAESAQYPRKNCVDPAQNLRPNRSVSDKEENNNKSTGRATRKRGVSKPDYFPRGDWCPEGLWSDFLENRRRKKLANTATAFKGFCDDLERFATPAWPPLRLLEYATKKGWASINPPDEDDYDGALRSGSRKLAHHYASSRDCRDGLERVLDKSLAMSASVFDVSSNEQCFIDGEGLDHETSIHTVF